MKKRRWMAGLLCLMLAVSMMGCGKKETAEETTAAETEAAIEEDTEEALEEDTEEELVLPEYDALEYVTLGDYTGLTVDVVSSTIDDETLEAELENALYDYSEEVEVTDGASDEDYISLTLQMSIDGEVVYEEEEEYSLLLGFDEFGEDVDAALVGAKAGDEISVDTVLDDMYGDDYEGMDAHYDIQVLEVYRYEVPELTEEFVKENTEYASVEEFTEATREQLQDSEDSSNHYEAEELAISLAQANAAFNGYPQELYDYCYAALEETYEWYASMFGMEVSDMISEEELDAYAMQEVQSNMVVQAIAQTEGLELTDESFEAYLEASLADFGCESVDEVKEYYADYELRNYAIRSIVGTFILDNSETNEMDRDSYDAIYYADEEEE